jgi:hypothetical protein
MIQAGRRSGLGRRCGPGRSRRCVVAREQGQHLAQGALLAGGFWQRKMRLDLVAVAPTVFLLDDVPGLGQVGDDAVSTALGDVQPGRDVAQAGPRVVRDAEQDRAWLVRKVQLGAANLTIQFWKLFASFIQPV